MFQRIFCYAEVMAHVYEGGFRRLIVWQEAKKFCLCIYALTKTFPKEEQFHLVPQLRRAAGSIMANIAEGSAMPTKEHRRSYYARARGSVVEIDSFLELCAELDYCTISNRDMRQESVTY